MKTTILALLLGLALATPLSGEENAENSAEHQIGAMVIAIERALKSPKDPESLEIIARYGTLTRHYVMIRGWLVQELEGVESQFSATRDPDLKAKHGLRLIFLKAAIRRIDLE